MKTRKRKTRKSDTTKSLCAFSSLLGSLGMGMAIGYTLAWYLYDRPIDWRGVVIVLIVGVLLMATSIFIDKHNRISIVLGYIYKSLSIGSFIIIVSIISVHFRRGIYNIRLIEIIILLIALCYLSWEIVSARRNR